MTENKRPKGRKPNICFSIARTVRDRARRRDTLLQGVFDELAAKDAEIERLKRLNNALENNALVVDIAAASGHICFPFTRNTIETYRNALREARDSESE